MPRRPARRDSAKAARTASHPLRRIVREVMVEVVPGCEVKHEELECGHTVPIKHDIYGPTNAYRRRCRKCGAVKKDTTHEEQ